MYLYVIYDYEEKYVVSSNKLYTKEQFNKMCEEAPKGGINKNFYSGWRIKEYLIKKYKFKEASFNISFDASKEMEGGN